MAEPEPVRTRERSERPRDPRAPRHLEPEQAANAGKAEKAEDFARSFATLGALAYEGARVSANVVDLRSGRVLLSIDDHVVLPTAGMGGILLLIEVSARLTARDVSGYGILDKTPRDAAGSSGIWQHLQAPALPVADLATLVGASSDNLATNVLLRQVGLDAVRERAESLGLTRTVLLDVVRDVRGPDDAPQLSVGSTAELAWLFGALARSEIVDELTSQRVMGWLALNSDLSMVASAFGLSPLAHRGVDHSTLLVNRTGTDIGVRSEGGALRGSRGSVAYAVSVQFDDVGLPVRLRALDAMKTVGLDLLEYVH